MYLKSICFCALFAVSGLARADHLVIDWVDEESGMVKAHIASHDFLNPLAHAADDDSHWSWVATSPTDAPVVTTIKYFVHNGAGLHPGGPAMTVAQVADIATAAGIWNASGANLNLVAAATDATADLHVHMDTTSACGPGPIGCAEFTYLVAHNPAGYGAGSGHPVPGPAGPHFQHKMMSNLDGLFDPTRQELTMYSVDPGGVAWPWYSGPAAGIPAGDLDYLSVAIQEFGHHLGLGHNDAAQPFPHGADIPLSPMNGLLPSGVTRRVLTPSDTAAIVHLYGAIPEPGTIVMLASVGLMGLVAFARRRRKPNA